MKTDLIAESLWVDVVHSFEMRVERVYNGKRYLQQILNDETKCHIIWKTNFVSNRHKPTVARYRHHFYGQGTADTKSSTASRKPKLYFLILVTLFGLLLTF